MTFLKKNKRIVENLDSTMSELEICAFLQAKWETMDETERKSYDEEIPEEAPEKKREKKKRRKDVE